MVFFEQKFVELKYGTEACINRERGKGKKDGIFKLTE